MWFQLFDVIFNERFQAILRRGQKNILNLMSCGALPNDEGSKMAIKSFSRLCVFNSL